MPKAKQTSINIFLRNPVPNDDREEENQSPEPEVQADIIQTGNKDVHRCSTDQKSKYQTIIQKRVALTIQMAKIRHCRWS